MLGHDPDPCPRPFAGRHRAAGRTAPRPGRVGDGTVARASAAAPCGAHRGCGVAPVPGAAADRRASVESWVYGEVLRSHAHAGSAACLYHYRDKDRREVDLLIEADGLLYPIECKKSAAPGRDALAGIAALAHQGAALGPGAVVCMAPEPVPLQAEPRVSAVPAWLL
jgi:predicted AAA+ superfamily ATPase